MSDVQTFHDGRATLHAGDCLAVLKGMADNSVDSCVTDPPYHLTSIVKRFGGANAAAAKDYTGDRPNATGAYARASRGFMGKQWDGGDIAFRAELWAEVLRVLKPGGHVVAFSGTRTYHRMACAIEDAGFEIRDCLFWCYGSGFPKNHDVSKAIDKRRDWSALPRLQDAIRAARTAAGLSQSEAARRMGLIGPTETLGGGGFMWFETGQRAPTREQWPRLKAALAIGDEFDACFEEAEREITGTVEEWTNRSNYALTSKDGFRRDKPASDLAAQWQGWGTALKPALEPICLGRKPLIGTVAENVLAHRTGAINIDGCRVPLAGEANPSVERRKGAINHLSDKPAAETEAEGKLKSRQTPEAYRAERPGELIGRHPANVVHDGSPEVLAGFPDTTSGGGPAVGTPRSKVNTYGEPTISLSEPYGANSGSAARFFYSAKADADDRLGSKHPTVKPVDLMRWLVRLITPPGGVTLDPFAGTGTTGHAALLEGFGAILIEREAEYRADIARRMSLVFAGETEKAHALIKARGEVETHEALPLFGGAA